MAGDGTLKFDTKIDTSGFENGLKKIKNETNNSTQGFDDGIERNKQSLLSLKNVAQIAGTYLSVNLFKDALTKGVQFNAQIEQYTTTFQTFTGSAEKANEVMSQLIDLGAQTPFETTDLADATQKLMSFGFTADEAVGSLTMLGDASQGSAEKLNSIVTAYGRMNSSGKVTLEDLNMMIDQGFNPLQQVAEDTGMSMAEVYDAISKGQLPVETVNEAIKKMTSEGGQYFGLMEAQSKTLNGQLSTLSDNVSMKLGEAFSGVNDILKNDLLPSLNSFLSGDISFSEFANNLANTFVDVASQIGTFADSLIQSGLDLAVKLSEGFVQGIPQFLSGILDFLEQAGEYLTANVPIWIQKGFEILSNLVQGIINALPEMIARLPQIITTFANIINDNFPTILAKGAELLLQLLGGIISAIPTLIANIPQIIEAIVSVFTAFNWLNLGSQIITFLGNGITAMIGFAQSCAQSIGQAIVNFLQSLPSQVMSIGSNIVSFFGNAISGGIGYVTSAVSSIASSIISGFASLPSKVISVGSNIVRGIWSGITGMGGWLMNQIKGFADGIVGGIKSFFGIKSPSRVMRDEVGKFLAQGISVGFEKEMPKSIKDIDDSLAKANMDMSARLAQLAYRGSQIMNPYYNNSITNNSTMNFYTKTVTADELQRAQRLSARYGLAGAR